MKYFLIGLLIMAAFYFGNQYATRDACANCGENLTSVGVDAFSETIADEEITIIDVRTAEEYASGHIEGAVQQDFYESMAFSEYLDSLDRDKPYAVYCRSGNRSGQTLQMMQEKGFTAVTDLSGGINAWNAARKPLVN